MNKFLFYNPRMVVAPDDGSSSFSRSWEKPKLFVEQILANPTPWYRLTEVLTPAPADIGDLSLAHDPAYVDGVLTGRLPTGFGDRSPAIADSCRYTCGAMASATLKVMSEGGMACVPVSGFHHAGYSHGGGFCTFNGLMVAALTALLHGANSVGIFDADQHYGDGTDDIIKTIRLPTSKLHHWTTGAIRHDPKLFLDNLRLQLMYRFYNVGVLLYQAGADCHVDDPLGGWMTTEQMRQRDQIVFDFCAERGIPLVWDLAGGYQNPYQRVLDLHLATWAEFVRAGT